MGFNVWQEKGIPLEKQIRNWETLDVQPYSKLDVDPYTRTRGILMNGIEVEAALFLHQFARHVEDMDLKRNLAMVRRVEQQQQKMVNWMIPASESTLEVTIGYEQVAVDLTAYLARTEPDPYVKAALDFALLEDFDHLYRYANLLEMDDAIKAERIVGDYTEIMPGRPTMDEHRHPFDSVRKHVDCKTADPLTNMHILTITAAEQQTMNYYMNVGNRYPSMLGRGLYLEIAQIEEQHVSHYESLADPNCTWLEMMAMHDYNEAYMYWSCMQSEPDPRVKQIWQTHLEMELAHLHYDRELVKQMENKDIAEMLPGEFPQPTIMQSNKDYVRQVMAEQTSLTANGTEFVPVDSLPKDHRFYSYQKMVNGNGFVPSRDVIKEHIEKRGQDYRVETEGPHPVEKLRARHEVPAEAMPY
jgi:hypothetical protein